MRMRRGAFASAALALAALAAAGLTGGARGTPGVADACAPGYTPCLPVVRDLDCGEIPAALKPVRVTGRDQYRLDRDRDGLGCDVGRKGGGKKSPWGLILRRPPKKEAKTVRVGDVLTVAGWSPRGLKGKTYELCVMIPLGRTCAHKGRAWTLNGAVQVFGKWRVARGEGRKGLFRLSLQVAGRIRASDTVALR